MTASYDAVLLTSFGGPEGPDDVLPFLRNVTRGKGIPDERLEEVGEHYRAFGGVSPINAQNSALRAALEAELARRGTPLPVLWGNRNWAPYIDDALREADAAGHRRLLAVVTSAYSSYSSCRQYREDLARSLDETGLAGRIHIDKVRQYFDHPGFVEPFVTGVRDALERLDLPDERVHVLFATHSIPLDAARVSGQTEGRDFGDEGAYGAQHRAVAEVVMAAQDRAPGWSLAYQSRSGPPSQPWLEPDVNEVIEALALDGLEAVVVVPIGFASDHMEVLWDLDEEARETAERVGIRFERVLTPGTDPVFVSGLADLVLERVELLAGREPGRAALTALGPWDDVCRPGCCANLRQGPLPAIAGEAP